jgi:hypothetical protein
MDDSDEARDYAITIGQLPEDFNDKTIISEDLW